LAGRDVRGVMVVKHEDALAQLLRDYRDAKLTRREAMVRAAALGLSAPALSGLLLAVRSERVAAAPALQDQPKSGGTLREGYDLDFSRMDPIRANWYDPGFNALYEAIITSDPDNNLVPQIAESWTVSEDGKSVTFTIRSGLKFHNGDPLTAASIKGVYDAIKDPANGSPLSALFIPVASIEAPDETTLTLTMEHPYYEVLHVVKTGYWCIVNMATWTKLGTDYGQQVIDGNGPFTFVEWVPGDHVSVKRWEDYPGSIVPFFKNKGKAYLDGITWVALFADASQRAIQIENGEIDAVHGPAFQDVARLESNPDLNVIRFKEWSGWILGANFTRTDLDFDKLEMRQAMSAAINRDAIAKALLFGEGEPLFGPVVSADPGYTKDVEQYNQFDLDKAKSLVAGLGWTAGSDGILTKNGVRMAFKMIIQAESFNQQLATVIQDQLKQLGMEVTVEAYDRGTYFNNLFSYESDAYIFYYLWPVPVDVVILFVTPGSSPNWQKADVPEVNDAVNAYLSAADQEALKAASAQFQVAVAKNLPIIPLINRNNIWVTRPNVHDYMPTQWVLYPYYNDVWMS
jgi:peptide/nickel transport system substrate-binding protein